MNFIDFYYNIFYPRIVTEDYESTIKQIKNIIQNNNLEPESINNILDVYNTVSVDQGRERAKKDSDLVALTYMYMVNNTDTVKREYASYLNSETSVNKKLLSKYIVELQNEIRGNGLTKPDKKTEKLELIKSKTVELIENIHRYQKKEEFTGTRSDESQDKVYEDENLVIFLADSKQKCIYYGRNSNLCISTKSGNYYWKYRMGKMRDDDLGMSTYFVYWKNRDGSLDENRRILIDALGSEDQSAYEYSWNPISPNQDSDISKNELEVKFPELIKPFSENVFKFLPYGEKEKRFQYIEESVKFIALLDNYSDFEMYLQTENPLALDDWNYIKKNVNDKELRSLLLLSAELLKLIPKDLQNKYFTEKEINRYENKIAENSNDSYDYAAQVLKGENVPDIILQGIVKYAYYSYLYAKYVLKGKDVPYIIVKGISKDSEKSYLYAKEVLEGKDVPDIIVQSISKDSEKSYLYAKDVLKGKDVPDIIVQSIARNLRNSYYYALDVFNGQNIPDIIVQSISKDSRYSYYYAKEIFNGQNIPDIIVQSISKDSEYSHYYAKNVLKGQNVPEIILQSIAKDIGYSYLYATDPLKGQNVPDIILQRIAKSSINSYLYAKDVLKGKDVPDIILQSIAKDPDFANSSLTEAVINSLTSQIIHSNANHMEEIENRNFSPDYASDSDSIIDDSNLKGFTGEGILDDSGKLVGYGYGYTMGADGEYDELQYIDMNDINFFNEKFKHAVSINGIENICTPKNTFYISNLVVDKPYRLYVKPLLNALLNNISSQGYKYIAFDGLSDTIRLFNSTRKASRLSGSNLTILAEVDSGESKLVLFYIR